MANSLETDEARNKIVSSLIEVFEGLDCMANSFIAAKRNDALWTGVPFGYDLTDNKTLIAFIAWLIALIAIYKSAKKDKWIILASVVTFIIFLIPHSLLGSELNYKNLEMKKDTTLQVEPVE